MNQSDLKNLRSWFKKNVSKRPWRPNDLNAYRDPYKVWISESMLQQTQIKTVYDYYEKWMQKFPNIKSLSKAQETEVFKYWQGLGYYSRAKNILKTAKILKKNNDSEFPNNRKELERLPGIGPYTAGAILSLAFHQKEAILDGNIIRIFSRFFELNFLPTDKNTKQNNSKIYWDLAWEIADNSKAYLNNEALMELGQTICKIKNPLCNNCPLHRNCKAYINNQISKFPPKKKTIQKEWHGCALIIEDANNRILGVKNGQKFFKGQLSLPHFETKKSATEGLPIEVESYINADEIIQIKKFEKFNHNITKYKIECDILHIKIESKKNSKKMILKFEHNWISKKEALNTFANSFSLKALKKIL